MARSNIAQARRLIERAALLLSDAASLLADDGHQQPARTVQAAAQEAAIALVVAEAGARP